MRLEHAADLLKNTSMMIGEVAAASGFDNCCSFARAFRARFGTSATRYRSAAASAKAEAAKSAVMDRRRKRCERAASARLRARFRYASDSMRAELGLPDRPNYTL